jgi:hypothetical protein
MLEQVWRVLLGTQRYTCRFIGLDESQLRQTDQAYQ